MGTVSPDDATVKTTGQTTLQMIAGRSIVDSGVTVTAKPGRNADLALTRGGSVLVCQSTAIRVTPAKDNTLLLALDRGALEIRMQAAAGDVVMTPDLRFSTADAGTFDLRMRVLSCGGVERQNHRMRRVAVEFFDHAHDLGQFLHQIVFVVQAACGVDQ